MGRVDEAWLVNLALGVLEEVAARAEVAMEPRSRSIRLSLAYLWWVAPNKDRWPFHNFWDAMTMTDDIARQANVSASLNAIYLALGLTREVATMSRFTTEAAARGPRNSH